MQRVLLSWNKPEDIRTVALALKKGEVVLGTTDTVVGFFADSTVKGFLSLNTLKRRQEKPYILLIQSVHKVLEYVQYPVSVQVETIMRTYWPGPLTLVLKAGPHTPAHWTMNGTVAFRVPHHEGIQKLLGSCEALFSTSANRAGVPAPRTMGEVDSSILDEMNYVIQDGEMEGVSSTILDCSTPTIRIVRQGTVRIELP